MTAPALQMGSAEANFCSPCRGRAVTGCNAPMVLSFRRTGLSARPAPPFGEGRRLFCDGCDKALAARRCDAKYCSNRCRQKSYRQRIKAAARRRVIIAAMIA
jgi:hypothetical protein